MAQVVHDYGGVCQAVTELADEMHAPITADEFRIFNRCLDDAIAEAVTEYTRGASSRSPTRDGSTWASSRTSCATRSALPSCRSRYFEWARWGSREAPLGC